MYVYVQPHPTLPDVPFLVDTGAAVSMLPHSWFVAIPPNERPELEKTPLTVFAANNTTFRITGVAHMQLKIQSVNYACMVHISPDEDTAIMGMDFITQHRVIVNAAAGKMTIGQRNIEVLDYHGQRLNCKITAAQTVHLQPKERYVVPGYLPRHELEQCTVVIEGANSLVQKHGVLAARVIAKARKHHVPIDRKAHV